MALADCVFCTPRVGDPLPERERIYSKNILFWAMEYMSIRWIASGTSNLGNKYEENILCIFKGFVHTQTFRKYKEIVEKYFWKEI